MSCGGGYALCGRVNTICGVESQGSRGWWWRRLQTLWMRLYNSFELADECNLLFLYLLDAAVMKAEFQDAILNAAISSQQKF